MAIQYCFANWKMYQSLTTIKKFLRDYKKLQKNYTDCSLGIAGSYEHLYVLQQKLKNSLVSVGAQDCSQFLYGAYTGQVCVQSLVEMNVKFCIIGHSEARQFLGQSDELIAAKFKLLLAVNITPIVCIGETLVQKEDGVTLQILFDQLEPILRILQSCTRSVKIFIAYEPIYAIGSGIIPAQKDLKDVFCFLKNIVKEVPVAKNVMFLYGGSVSAKTIDQFKEIDEISGFLIGKASIDFQELKKVVESI